MREREREITRGRESVREGERVKQTSGRKCKSRGRAEATSYARQQRFHLGLLQHGSCRARTKSQLADASWAPTLKHRRHEPRTPVCCKLQAAQREHDGNPLELADTPVGACGNQLPHNVSLVRVRYGGAARSRQHRLSPTHTAGSSQDSRL